MRKKFEARILNVHISVFQILSLFLISLFPISYFYPSTIAAIYIIPIPIDIHMICPTACLQPV